MALSSSESEYEVKEILRHRKRGGTMEYYVTWKDFDESEDQWVKEKDIHATALLEKYKQSMNTKGKSASKKAGATTLSKKTSTRSAKGRTVTSVKESSVITQEEQGSKSYDYVESAGKDFGRDDIPLLKQKSSEVSTVIVQESGDLGSTVSESSDVDIDTPMVTRHTSTVSRTIIKESGDAGRTRATNTLLSLNDSSSSDIQKSQSNCETVSLLIFISCFLFVIASIVLEKHDLLN